MTETEQANGKLTPAYVSWKTFESFIGSLKGTTIPPRIDNTVMSGKSGAVQSQLRTAMKFLGLVDDDDRVLEAMKLLVAAHGSREWPGALKELLGQPYVPFLKGLPFQNGTAQQLHERFRDVGDVSGATLTKAIRFFLKALDEAGVEYSPHFKAPTPPRRPRKPKRKGEEGEVTNGGVPRPPLPPVAEGVQRILFPLPGRDHPVELHMPKNISETEWSMVDTYVRGFIALSP